jgi:putative phage-type endonuclease
MQNVDDLTPSVTAFSDAAVWTGVTDSDREKWLDLRATMVTASDVAAILGEDPHRSPLDVYVDKVMPRGPQGKLCLDDPRFWGHILEQPILEAVARYYGWQYRRGGALLKSRQWPWLGCTLDAEINRGSGWIPFEGKTTRIPRGWNQEDSELPIRVLLQHQTQITVTCAPQGLVFALLQGSRPCQIEQEPVDELRDIIVEATSEFVKRVSSLDPPPAGALDQDSLARLHPNAVPDAAIELPPLAAEWLAELQDLASRRLDIETRERGLKNRIVQLLGDATIGVLPHEVGGKIAIKAAWEEKAEHVVKALRSRPVRQLKHLPKVITQQALALSERTLKELLEQSLQEKS